MFLITITLENGFKIRKVVKTEDKADVEDVANRHIIRGSYRVNEFTEFDILSLEKLEEVLVTLSDREEI